jgi:hypothetical protein
MKIKLYKQYNITLFSMNNLDKSKLETIAEDVGQEQSEEQSEDQSEEQSEDQSEDQLSFFMLASGQKTAVEYSIKSVRKWYPDNPFLLIENGTNCLESIAEMYGCIYQNQPNYQILDEKYQYYRIKNRENIAPFLQQFLTAVDVLQTKWIIYMESDAWIRHPIVDFPPDDVGIGGCLHSFNTFEPKAVEIINKVRDDKELEHMKSDEAFTLTGGSIFSREKMKDALSQTFYFPKEVHEMFFQDVLISYIFKCHGYRLYDWCELSEEKHETDEQRRLMSAIVHSVKYFYEKKQSIVRDDTLIII